MINKSHRMKKRVYVRLLTLFLWSFVTMPTIAVADETRRVGRLDIEQLDTGRHQFLFKAGESNTGLAIEVPIIVIKGANAGNRLLLTAGVHGDELNGIRVIHHVLATLDPTRMSGTVIAVPGVNQPGLWANSRYFVSATGGGNQEDLNRVFPGQDRNASAAKSYAHALWHNIFAENADFAVDLHTQTQGTTYPLFVFADFRHPLVRDMAYLLGPDMIKNDAGEEGTLETALMQAGVPALTFEIGAPKIFQQELIERASAGLVSVMRKLEILEGAPTAPEIEPVVGNDYINIFAKFGGPTVIETDLKAFVKKGDLIATQYDLFGNIRHAYYAPLSGHVLAVAVDPLREPGSLLVRILY